MPGHWLLAIAHFVFDRAVIDDVVRPTIADLQHEWLDPAATPAHRTAALIAGYIAFWRLVFMSPLAFATWPGRSKEPRFPFWSILIGAAIIIVLSFRVDVSAVVWPLVAPLPEGTMRTLGTGGMFAFLAAPMMLAWLLVRRRVAAPGTMRIRPAEVTLVGLVSIALTSLLGAAGLMGAFEGIGNRGHSGLAIVTDSVVGATQPMLVAIATAIAFAIVSLFTLRDTADSAAAFPVPSKSMAVALSITLCVIVFAIDRLLAMQHTLLRDILVILEPVRVPGGPASAASAIEESTGFVLFGGVSLTLLTVAGSLVVWRATRSRLVHPMFRTVSAIVAVAVIAGGVWHGLAIKSDLDAFHDNVRRMQAAATRSR